MERAMAPDNRAIEPNASIGQSVDAMPQPVGVGTSTQRRGTVNTVELRNGLTHGFRALSIRNYRLYWIGQLVSLTGSWMQTTAQAWLVLKLTNSPFALGLVTTLQFLPIMLLSLFGGVIADRFPKYPLVIATQTLALIQAVIFGF